jgi:hypothetical protein
MHKSKTNPDKLHQVKNAAARARSRRIPSLLSLIYAGLVWCLVGLGLVSGPWSAPRAADPVTDRPPTVKQRLTQAQLDERAPLLPQEQQFFDMTRKSHRTARRIYQTQGTLSQTGRRQPEVKAIAAFAGVNRKTVQRANLLFEKWGLSQRIPQRIPRRKRKVDHICNGPNILRFPLREQQLQIPFQNVAHSKKNLILNTKTAKNLAWDGAGGRRLRPSNHPAAFRAAWEARRKANHPPEMRRAWEEKARFFEDMRGWKPKRRTEILRRAVAAQVGAYFPTTAERIRSIYDAAERMGLGPRIRRRWEAEDLVGADAIDEQRAADRAAWDAKIKNFLTQYQEKSEQMAKVEPDPARAIAATNHTNGQNMISETAIATCERCDGKRRIVVGGRIVVCPCSPGER